MSGNPVTASSMSKARSWRDKVKGIERDARLWSGIILMVFATSHFLNHGLGVFGIDVMTAAQEWRVLFWRSWIGTVLLYGSAAIHVLLALKRVVRRRTLRMPLADAIQMTLGLLIPFMLIGHIIGTRLLSSFGGVDTAYVHILRVLWPDNAINQTLLLLIVWCHGVMGLYYAFHNRRWFAAWLPVLTAVAAVIPAISLAGFLAASRESAISAIPPLQRTEQQFALQAKFGMIATWSMSLVFAAAALVLLIRFVRSRLGKRITVRYFGNGQVQTVVGASLLEISRCGNIPHPSACGGRGRCSSCRVLILEGEQSLAPPTGVEKRVLERIRAPRHIRLACQIHPTADLNVRVLLGGQAMSAVPEEVNEALDWGVSEELTVLSADIRGFATLAEHQLPSDVIALLNRLIGEMAHAVEGRGRSGRRGPDRRHRRAVRHGREITCGQPRRRPCGGRYAQGDEPCEQGRQQQLAAADPGGDRYSLRSGPALKGGRDLQWPTACCRRRGRHRRQPARGDDEGACSRLCRLIQDDRAGRAFGPGLRRTHRALQERAESRDGACVRRPA